MLERSIPVRRDLNLLGSTCVLFHTISYQKPLHVSPSVFSNCKRCFRVRVLGRRSFALLCFLAALVASMRFACFLLLGYILLLKRWQIFLFLAVQFNRPQMLWIWIQAVARPRILMKMLPCFVPALQTSDIEEIFVDVAGHVNT